MQRSIPKFSSVTLTISGSYKEGWTFKVLTIPNQLHTNLWNLPSVANERDLIRKQAINRRTAFGTAVLLSFLRTSWWSGMASHSVRRTLVGNGASRRFTVDWCSIWTPLGKFDFLERIFTVSHCIRRNGSLKLIESQIFATQTVDTQRNLKTLASN